MKSFIVIFLSVCCLVVSLQAAAVERVVEELQKGDAEHPVTESVLTTNQDCIQPKETGRCFALFYRFAFDVEKRECTEFIYGGCAGNSNNFETKEDCEAKCINKLENTATNDSATTVVPEAAAATENVASS